MHTKGLKPNEGYIGFQTLVFPSWVKTIASTGMLLVNSCPGLQWGRGWNGTKYTLQLPLVLLQLLVGNNLKIKWKKHDHHLESMLFCIILPVCSAQMVLDLLQTLRLLRKLTWHQTQYAMCVPQLHLLICTLVLWVRLFTPHQPASTLNWNSSRFLSAQTKTANHLYHISTGLPLLSKSSRDSQCEFCGWNSAPALCTFPFPYILLIVGVSVGLLTKNLLCTSVHSQSHY